MHSFILSFNVKHFISHWYCPYTSYCSSIRHWSNQDIWFFFRLFSTKILFHVWQIIILCTFQFSPKHNYFKILCSLLLQCSPDNNDILCVTFIILNNFLYKHIACNERRNTEARQCVRYYSFLLNSVLITFPVHTMFIPIFVSLKFIFVQEICQYYFVFLKKKKYCLN